jgi:hypothetical protein
MRPRTQALKLCWRDRLTDAYIESYVDWRQGCADVHSAYRRWALSDPRDRDLGYQFSVSEVRTLMVPRARRV